MSDASLPFFGPYRVIRTLARGGMAEIFLARKEGPAGFTKTVVVKRIRSEHSANEEFVDMFRDEARLAAQLDHPNIVHITDFGEVQGSYFLAMEFLQGADLGSLLAMRLKAGQGPFPPALTAHVGAAACAGLHYAHTFVDAEGTPLRIVHRDISPNNVFLTFQGAVKVLDFGIAKAEGKLVQTRAGLVKGKLLYMSPEQTWGKLLDARSDVWALGVVLYELLTGKRAFFRAGEANASELNERMTMEAIDRETPPAPSSIVPGLTPQFDEIVLKCLEKDPAHRWQTAADLQHALETFIASCGGVTTGAVVAEIERMVGKEQIRALTQPTPMGQKQRSDPQAALATAIPPADKTTLGQTSDPQAAVATEFRPASDPQAAVATEFRPAGDAQAAIATEFRPAASADEATRLQAARAGAPAERAATAAAAVPATGPPRRSALPAVALGVLLLAGLGAGGWFLFGRKPPPPTPTDGTGELATPPVKTVTPPPTHAAVEEPDAGASTAQAAAAEVTDAGLAAAEPEQRDAGSSLTGAVAVRSPQTRPPKPKVPRVHKDKRAPVVKVETPATGQLKVSCPPYGAVYAGDRELGRASPELVTTLPVGSHRIRCVHPSFGESSATVQVEAGATAVRKLQY